MEVDLIALVIALEDFFFLTVVTAELRVEFLLQNIIAPKDRATIALLMTFVAFDVFPYTCPENMSLRGVLLPLLLPVVTTQMCSLKCPDLAISLGRIILML